MTAVLSLTVSFKRRPHTHR